MRAAGGAAGGAAGQALAVVWIAKTSTSETLGQYALALAVVSPILLFARMQLRFLLAAQHDAPFGVYLRSRLLATGSCALLIAAVAAGLLETERAWVISLVAFSRAIEDLGDLLYGLRQRQGRWNRIASSQVLRGVGGAVFLAAGMTAGGSLGAGLLANLAWQIGVTVWVDAKGLRWPAGEWRVAAQSLRSCWPLGAAGALVSLTGNLPRYALEMVSGSDAVGYFTALSQVALLGNLPVQAMGVAALTELGRRARFGRRSFARLVALLAAVSVVIGLVGQAAAIGFGEAILQLLYTPEIAATAPLLKWVIAGAMCTFLAATFGYGLVSLGEKRAQMYVFGLSALAGLVACWSLVPAYGLEGAILANLVCWSSAAFLAGGALYIRALDLPSETADCSPPPESSKLSPCSAPAGSSYPSAS